PRRVVRLGAVARAQRLGQSQGISLGGAAQAELLEEGHGIHLLRRDTILSRIRTRHARACPGHPRRCCGDRASWACVAVGSRPTWIAGTSPAMTIKSCAYYRDQAPRF